MEFTLNGRGVSTEVRAGETLLEVLRERFGLRSPKDGCAPEGSCGACTVLLDGRPVVSCAQDASRVEGRDVVTLEGLPAEARDAWVDAFSSAGAVQCGYCTPGLVMKSEALLRRSPDPSREEIARALAGNLCRCTGYVKVIDAVRRVVAARRGDGVEPVPAEVPAGAPAPAAGAAGAAGGRFAGPSTGAPVVDLAPAPPGRVGAPTPKCASRRLVLGEHLFVRDMAVPGMLHAALRFSDHPRARVLHIDTSRAEAVPGVVRVATATDVPGRRYQGLISADWPAFLAEGETTRCVGDVLAAVAAETRHAAREAAALVAVEYDVLEPVTDPFEALAANAPAVHEGGNLLSVSTVRHGDVDAALGWAAHVVAETFRTQPVEHAFLEPEACLAMPAGRDGPDAGHCCGDGPAAGDGREGGGGIGRPHPQVGERFPDGGPPAAALSDVSGTKAADPAATGLRVYSQGQGAWEDRRQIASLLGLPEQAVRVTQVPTGGAFGGKEDLSVQGQAALLALLTGRPLHLALTRRESIRLHPKRHALTMAYTAGCDAEGRLVAVRARIVGDTGAYASVGDKVLERAAGHACGAYRVPNVDVQARAVYTNNPPAGAMRGFGVVQVTFAIEGMLDRLAELAGLDGWEIRWRNALDTGDRFGTGQLLGPGVGVRRTLLAVRDAYRSARFAGIACAAKNTGVGNGMTERGRVILRPEPGGCVTLFHSWTEMGQGVHTVLRQIASQELGMPADRIRVVVDTERELDTGQTTASRATTLGGQAVLDAARHLKAALGDDRMEDLAGQEFAGEYVVDWTTGNSAGEPVTHFAYAWATQVAVLDDRGRLAKVIAAQDVGRALNPLALEGQIEGGVHMGLGLALTEELPLDRGVPAAATLKSLGILPAAAMPPVECILVEEPQPEGPYGAKGAGEAVLVPTPAAVAGALHAFDGRWRTALPMRDSAAARAALPRLAREARGTAAVAGAVGAASGESDGGTAGGDVAAVDAAAPVPAGAVPG